VSPARPAPVCVGTGEPQSARRGEAAVSAAGPVAERRFRQRSCF